MIDMLKEAVLRSGCLDRVTSAGSRGDLDTNILAERLLLVVYACGTNTGIRAIAGGDHGHSEDDLRYVRRRYLTVDVAQALAIDIANATFRARRPDVWGAGSSAVASDSTHLGALDQNIFTEWHARYGGRGVLIYWHVERKSMAMHSQLISCSASEVAAMVEGAMHHGTEMTVEGTCIASHRRDEQDLSVLCLRILQVALVYVNTLMIQDILTDDRWVDRLTAADRRGLTPLFWSHVAPYGEVRLNMDRRLDLASTATSP